MMKQNDIDIFKQKQLTMAKRKAERQKEIEKYSSKPKQTAMDF